MTPQELEDDPFLTPAQIAKIFAVKPYTVRNWIAQGKFDQSRVAKIGNRLRVRRSAVTDFAQSLFGSEEEETNDFV